MLIFVVAAGALTSIRLFQIRNQAYVHIVTVCIEQGPVSSTRTHS